VGRAERITEHVKIHDRELYCAKSEEGKLCVYRKSTRWETYDLGNGDVLHFARPAPHFIFALTDNWKMDGKPVERGLLNITERLCWMDSWKRDLADEAIRQQEKAEQSSARKRRNDNEAFFSDFRKQFARATDGVNVSNLEKKSLKTF
jgi:hypothetical protein